MGVQLPASLKKLLPRYSSSSIGSSTDGSNHHPASSSKFREGRNPYDGALFCQAQAKFDEAERCLKARDLESSERLFNQALRNRLMLFGADSEHVQQCHSKLVDIACLQHDFEKMEKHLAVVQRIRSAKNEGADPEVSPSCRD